MRTTLWMIALAALATGCASDGHEATRTDTRGNYASTAEYSTLERADFTAAMEAGLRDFDTRLVSLKLQAENLGADALDEFHDHVDDLMEQRRVFDAELQRHRSMLAEDWREHREDVGEMYNSLRENLDEAFADVIDAA